MSSQPFFQKTIQIKRTFYGLVVLLITLFVVLSIVINWKYQEKKHLDELINQYHRPISEKIQALINSIDQTKLWFLQHDIDRFNLGSVADTNSVTKFSEFSVRDTANAFKYKAEKLVIEINTIQKHYVSQEFNAYHKVLQQVLNNMLVDFNEFQSAKSLTREQIDAIVKPFIPVTHQLLLLHEHAYQRKLVELADKQQDDEAQLISLVIILMSTGFIGIIFMQSHIQKILKALTKSQSDLQAERDLTNSLTHAAPVLVILLDGRGCIRHVNHYFEQLSGYQLEEVKGMGWVSNFFPVRDQDRLRFLLQSVRDEQAVEGNVYTLVTRNGEGRMIEWIWGAVSDGKGSKTDVLFVGQDVTGRKQGEQELQQFRRTLDQTHDCVFIFSADSLCFTYVNEGAVQQVGYSRDELLIMHPYDIKPEYPKVEFNKLIAPLLAGEYSSINFGTTHQHKNGRIVPVDIVLQYIAQQEDAPARFVAIVRDITEHKEAEAELREYQLNLEDQVQKRTAALGQARDEAERANAAKSEFLSSMSHELRTPMNAVLGFSQLLASDTINPLTEDQRESIEYIIEGGEHLLELIDGVLNLSEIENGHTEVNLTLVNTKDLIDQVSLLVQPQAAQLSIRIVNNVADKSVLTIKADHQKLKQVLLNLASNAVKYNSNNGSITFSCTKANKEKIRLCVSDTGEGIPEELIPAIFEPFNRLGKANSTIQGSGIGLSISKKLVNLMGGQIGVFRNSEKGMTFWVEFDSWGDVCQQCSKPA